LQIFYSYVHLVTILMLSLTLLEKLCVSSWLLKMHQKYNQVPPLGRCSPDIKGGKCRGSGTVGTRKQQDLAWKMLWTQCLPDTLWDTATSTTTATNGATDSLCLQELHLPHSTPPPPSREHRDEASCPKHVSHQVFKRAIWKITGIFLFFLNIPLLNLSPRHHASSPNRVCRQTTCCKGLSGLRKGLVLSQPAAQAQACRWTLGTACPLLVSLSSTEGQGLGGHG